MTELVQVSSQDLKTFSQVHQKLDHAAQFLTWLHYNGLLNEQKIQGLGVSLNDLAIQYVSPSDAGVAKLLRISIQS